LSISAIKVSDLEGHRRFDAEYYQPRYLEAAKRFEHFKALANYKPIILHPTEVKRVYEEEGLQLLFTQNIRNNFLNFSHVEFLPFGVEEQIRKNRLQPGDVVVTRTGANYGDAAPYDGNPSPIYASAHCIIIRCKDVPGGYLSTYFNTEVGRALLKRGVYGAAQPEIAPDYIRTLHIPRFGEKAENQIEQKLFQAKHKRDESEQLYAKTERLLAAELGLDRLDLSENLFNVRRVSDVMSASRMDAEHYKQKYYRVLETLENIGANEVVPIQQMVTTLTNGHTPLHHDLDVGDIPFLTAEHVYDFWLDYDNARRIWREHHETEVKRTQLRENDVLITIKGRVGNAAVVERLPGDVNINQDVALLRLKPGIHPYYVVGFLNSPAGKTLMEQNATGQINPFLGLGNLAKVRIPIFDEKRMNAIGENIRQTVAKGYQAKEDAKRLLAEAKSEVERMVERG